VRPRLDRRPEVRLAFFSRKPLRIEPSGVGPEIGVEPEPARTGPPRTLTACHHCGRPMLSDATLCMGCGHATASRPTSADLADRPARPCLHCGYDLSGLRASVCPECGKPILRGSRRRATQAAVEDARKEWIRSLIVIGVSCLVVTVVAAFKPSPWSFGGALDALASDWSRAGVLAAGAMIGYWFMMLTYLGQEGTFANDSGKALAVVMASVACVRVAQVPFHVLLAGLLALAAMTLLAYWIMQLDEFDSRLTSFVMALTGGAALFFLSPYLP